MTFNPIPALPPSFSHDTIHSIHSLYATPLLFTSSTSSSIAEDEHEELSLTSIPSLDESPLTIPSISSHPAPFPSSRLVNPASQMGSNPSFYSQPFEEIDSHYRSGCSLDVEISSNRQSFSNLNSFNPSSFKANTDSIQSSSDERDFVREDFNISLQDKRTDLETHPRFQQLLEENASLRSKLAQLQSPSTSLDSDKKNNYVASNFCNKILQIMATQILQLKQHIELKSNRFHHEPLTLWFTAFSSRLNSMENPVEKQVITMMEEFFYHLQAHLDTWLLLSTIVDESKPLTSNDLSSTTGHPLTSSSSSSLSSLCTDSSSSLQDNESQGIKKEKPSIASPLNFPSTSIPCVSCLRLRNALEAQTQALTTLCSEKEKKEHQFLEHLAHFERVFHPFISKDEPNVTSSNVSSPSVSTGTDATSSSPNVWTLSLSKLETHLLNTFQSYQDRLKQLEIEVQTLKASKLKLKLELKHVHSQLQAQTTLLESKYNQFRKESLEWQLKYGKQAEMSNDLKKKIIGLKKILQELEQRAVDEVIKHKSTKDLYDQLRLRVKTLSESQEKYKKDLALSHEHAQKLNSTMERQTRYLQVLKSKPNNTEETLNLQQSLEEYKKALEETKTNWMHEKTIRQRGESKLQSLQCKIDLLQKLLNEKESTKSSSHVPPPFKDTFNDRKPTTTVSFSSSYLLNQYKLAITDFIQWLYSFNKDWASIKTHTHGHKPIKNKSVLNLSKRMHTSTNISLEKEEESFSLNVPKTLIDQLSNQYLHIPYDELVQQLEQGRQELPSQALTSIFSSRKNVRSLLFQFLKQCTDEVLQFHEIFLFHSKVNKSSNSNLSDWISKEAET